MLSKKIAAVESYLMKHFDYNMSRKLVNFNKLAMIIEPRCHHRLKWTIINTLHFLGEDYDLLFIGSHSSVKYMKKKLPDIECHVETIHTDNLNSIDYSKIMMNKSLIEKYNYEHIIVFQTDSILLKPLPDYIYSHNYIGAIDYMKRNNKSIMKVYNGGFSYRKRSFLLHCLDNISMHDINAYRRNNDMVLFDEDVMEDFYYSNCLYIQNEEININIFGQNQEFFNNDLCTIHSYDKDSDRFMSFNCVISLLNKSHNYIQLNYYKQYIEKL